MSDETSSRWPVPRRVDVVVDNDSWVLSHAAGLVATASAAGHDAMLLREHGDVRAGAVAFYLGCVRITPPDVLDRAFRNLVVHASDLPKGRGFSPMTWLTLDGLLDIPVCLFESGLRVDEGPVVYRDLIRFEGHELVGEMRDRLGAKSVELCLRYLAETTPPVGTPQEGEPSFYARRRPGDSRLDPDRTIGEQFDLLRTVDNTSYPAFFDYRGHRYRLAIEKVGPQETTS